MGLRLHTPIPSLSGAGAWLNTSPIDARELVGQPLLIYFFALGCEMCHQQLPEVARWLEELAPRGVRFIGIHTPVHGTPEETGVAEVERFTRQHGLSNPIAIDDRGQLARRFDVRATPSYFVFDTSGELKLFHSGAYAPPAVRAALERVLQEAERKRAEREAPAPT